MAWMFDEKDFKEVAECLNKPSLTDRELRKAIRAYRCLLAYFRARGHEYIVTFALQFELDILESYASDRGWKPDAYT